MNVVKEYFKLNFYEYKLFNKYFKVPQNQDKSKNIL